MLDDASEPEPDVVVARGALRSMRRHPRQADILLVIEVADSSLAYDEGEKAGLYARAHIAEYWVLDLPGKRLIVRRDPMTGPDGAAYETDTPLTAGDSVSLLLAPAVTVRVAEMLP